MNRNPDAHAGGSDPSYIDFLKLSAGRPRAALKVAQVLYSLRKPHRSIGSAGCQQSVMRTFFGDLSLIKDENPLCRDNR